MKIETARRVWLALFGFVVSGGLTMMVSYAFVTRWGIRTSSVRDGLWFLMDGQAWRPFVFRRLAPELVSHVTKFAETRFPGAVDRYLSASTLARLFLPEQLSPHEQLALHVAYLLVWLGLLATVFSGTLLLRTLRQVSWFEALITSSLSICLLPMTLSNGGYIYDPLELFLWTTLLWCLVGRVFILAIPVFLLMLANKESGLALVPALLPLLNRQLGRKQAIVWTVLAGIVAAAWLLVIRRAYAHNPGMDQEWSLWSNLIFWATPSSYARFAAMYSPALPGPRGANVAILLLLAIPIRVGWSQLRDDFKHSALLAGVILVPLFVVSGMIDETRALGPLFPYLVVAASEGIGKMYTRAAAPVT
jgi:hypothetical protein